MTSLAVPVGCERSLLPHWGFSPQGRAAVGSVGNVPGVSTAGLQPGEHVLRKLSKGFGFLPLSEMLVCLVFFGQTFNVFHLDLGSCTGRTWVILRARTGGNSAARGTSL